HTEEGRSTREETTPPNGFFVRGLHPLHKPPLKARDKQAKETADSSCVYRGGAMAPFFCEEVTNVLLT
ncbi:MAG: hypothetical protein WC565_08710, partial [Parcubacteria group bacterium]